MENFEENKIEENKDEKIEEKPVIQKPTVKKRINHWKIASVVLLALFLVSIVSGGFTGAAVFSGGIGQDSAAETTENFVNTLLRGQAIAEVLDVSEEYGLYKIDLNINGEETVSYLSKDGNKFFAQPIDIEEYTALMTGQGMEPTGGDVVVADGEEDWTVFENTLQEDIETKIFSFPDDVPAEYEGEERFLEFENFEEIPNILIVFYHAGCGWCTKYYPVLVSVQEKYPNLVIYALDFGIERDIGEKYGVSGTPATIINGKYFASGYMDEETLTGILDKLTKEEISS